MERVTKKAVAHNLPKLAAEEAAGKKSLTMKPIILLLILFLLPQLKKLPNTYVLKTLLS